MFNILQNRYIFSVRDRILAQRANITAMSSFSTTPAQASSAGPVESSIREKLIAALQPLKLRITNDSWQHRHHAAMRAQGDGNEETHFSVHAVSETFRGKSTMQRHRMIYSALSEELSQGLHALSLKTKTPEEYQKEAA